MKVSRKDFEDHATKKCQWRTVHCDHCCELYPDCQMEVNNHILQSLQQTPPPRPPQGAFTSAQAVTAERYPPSIRGISIFFSKF